MNASATRAELAVVNVLRQLDASVDCRVDVRAIERRWSEYGIRAPDLHGAITRLSQTDRLKRFQDGDRESVALTLDGEAWWRAQPAWLEYLLLVPRRSRVAQQIGPGRRPANRPVSRKSDRKPATTAGLEPALH